MKSADPSTPGLDIVLPSHRALFYGGQWHAPVQGGAVVVRSPSTGEELGKAPEATGADVERAVAAGRRGFEEWRRVTPLERARVLARVRGDNPPACGGTCAARRSEWWKSR